MRPVTPLRRFLFIVGLLILLGSLCLLIVAHLPNQHVRERLPVAPEDLSLPTPEALRLLPRDAPCLPPASPHPACRRVIVS